MYCLLLANKAISQGLYMKSLIEEASSVSKAIEKAWERAGKPHSFSVKIFEFPEKNFIGMTTKYAKVGVFFEDKKISETALKSHEKTTPITVKKQFEKKSSAHIPVNPKAKEIENNETAQSVEFIKKNKIKSHVIEDTKKQDFPAELKCSASNTEQIPNQITATWSIEMKTHLETWLKRVLSLIDLGHVEFTCHEQKNILKINFDSPLIANELKESLLYKNLSYLGMVSLRTHFKNEMKNLKILLSRE